MPPSFSDIRYFIETVQTGNISRAAEKLGITQPSLSSSIKRLEDTIGTQLLIRSRTGVSPTKAGKALTNKGRHFIQNWEQLKTEIVRHETTITGLYTIGCHPSVALYTLPHFLPQLMSNNPHLEIQLEHDLSRRITEKVISHQIDFGLVVNPIRHPDLVIKELCTDEVAFWTISKPTNNQKLANENKVLICDPNILQSQKLMNDLHKKKISFKRIIYSSNLDVVTELTMSGAGIGIIPTRVATRHSSHRLKSLNKQLPTFKDKICMIYRADSQKTKSRDLIVKSIQLPNL